MQSVAQVNNLAQFMKIVGAARERNNALSSGIGKSNQASRPVKQFSLPKTGFTAQYSNVQKTFTDASETVNKPEQTKKLGTKFDAYA